MYVLMCIIFIMYVIKKIEVPNEKKMKLEIEVKNDKGT